MTPTELILVIFALGIPIVIQAVILVVLFSSLVAIVKSYKHLVIKDKPNE